MTCTSINMHTNSHDTHIYISLFYIVLWPDTMSLLHNHCATLIYASPYRHTEHIIYLSQPLSASEVALSERAAVPMTTDTLSCAMESEHISLVIQQKRI